MYALFLSCFVNFCLSFGCRLDEATFVIIYLLFQCIYYQHNLGMFIASLQPISLPYEVCKVDENKTIGGIG